MALRDKVTEAILEHFPVPEDYALPAGTYELQYEKKMHTICAGNHPANLDAFLSDESSKTAIFCEMKQLEWLDPPKKLKDGYHPSQ